MTLTREINGQEYEFDMRYYPGYPATWFDPPEPDEYEVHEVRQDGQPLTPAESDLLWDQYAQETGGADLWDDLEAEALNSNPY